MAEERSLEGLTAADFQPYVESEFRVQVEAAEELPLGLSRVEALGASTDDADPGRREPFSLLFHGAVEPVLPQRTYRLEHDELGALELFLVPIGPDDAGMRYEAIFA